MWGAVGSGPLSESHSRIRLRAPDEVEPEASASASAAGRGGAHEAAEPGTAAFQQAVPHLDVGSPDYIEERLENLKRRLTWASYLDQYVEAFPDDDDDEAEPEERRYYDHKARYQSAKRSENPSGFMASLTWSTLVLGLWPILLLLYPFLRHKGQGFWPMGCSSMGHLLSRSVLNILFLLFGLLLLYWAICRELPELDVENVLIRLDVRLAHLLDAGRTCQTAMQEFEVPLVRELCTGVGVDTAFVVATGWLVFHCHWRWARYAMLAMTMVFFFDGPTRLYDATFPAPVINHIDPTYAMVDEEITIALDGQNLKPGGNIAWVSYWGCATTSDVAACEKQFSSVFSMGVVHVTFKSIDHFIPCYRDPPNPLKAQEYVCFPDVRIRVKDKQSIPGWSKIQQPTPVPSIVVAPNAVSEVSAASIDASKRPAPVDDNYYEEEEHVDEPSAVLGDATAVGDDDSDSDKQYPESTDQGEQPAPDDDVADLRSADGINTVGGDASTSEHHDLDSSINVAQPTLTDGHNELRDLSTDDEALHLLDDQQQATSNETLDGEPHTTVTTDDQAMKIMTVGVQATFDVIRLENEGDGIESETKELVEVEVQTTVKELLQTTEEEAVAVVKQGKLVEVEIAAADPSSLTLVIDEVSSSEVSVQDEPEPVTTPERLVPEESASPEAKLTPLSKQAKELGEGEDQETDTKIQDEGESSTAANDDDQVKPALASVAYTTVEDESSDEDAQADFAEHVETAQHETVPVDSRAKSPKLVALDDIEVEVTLEQKPSEEKIAPVDPSKAPSQPSEAEVPDSAAQANDGLKHKSSERPAQDNQRDRCRVQEREHSSISSIRVDRRGSQGQPPRPSRQSSSSTVR